MTITTEVTQAEKRRNLRLPLIAIAIVLLVAAIYSPLRHAGLVWVDKICFEDEAWLRYDDAWKHLIFRGFYEWVNYFRPLVLALFTFELRVLDGSPGAMHMVSLGIHLANTLFVCLLSRRLSKPSGSTASLAFSGAAMAIYGLHPALIEPIAWISCQFELVVTLFILMGLLLHISDVRPGIRVIGVAICFFLAACAKESAIAMPVLLVLADLTRQSGQSQSLSESLRTTWYKQRATYVSVLVAGVAYLALRYWALGFLVAPYSHKALPLLDRLQTVAFVYTTYLRIIVWPMTGLGPLHIVDTHRFATIDMGLAIRDLIAGAILALAIAMSWRRNAGGYLLLAATAALFPALHVIPVEFDPSLYHERYAMTAIAAVCAWLPSLRVEQKLFAARIHPLRIACILGAGWIVMAIANIAITLPLWSDEVKLWQWVLVSQPDSVTAKDHLLSTYIERNDLPNARALANSIIADRVNCPTCLLNAANLALADQDEKRAESILVKLQHSPYLANNKSLYVGYVVAIGQLLELQGDFAGAEQSYRSASKLDPYKPVAAMQLALLLARQGRAAEARGAASKAFALFPRSQREERKTYFEQVLASPPATKRPTR